MIDENTIRVLVWWIINNRRGDAFKNYPANKIANEIKAAIAHNVFCFTYNNKSITGIACGEKHENGIFIHDVLTTKKGSLKQMIEHAVRLYPEHAILGMRRGKYSIIHRPASFVKRIK